MTHDYRIAIFGVNTLGLLLGQAVRLSDHSRLELYDPNPQAALRGSLFLGVSAWTKLQPSQNAVSSNLDVMLLTNPLAAPDFRILEKSGRTPSLIIKFFPQPLSTENLLVCQALPPTLDDLELSEITKRVPEMTFHLNGTPEAVEKGSQTLTALSRNFTVQSG